MSRFDNAFFDIETERFLAGLLINSEAAILARYIIDGLDAASEQALFDVAKRIFNYPEGLIALKQFAESIFYDIDGRRLICRVLELDDTLYLLVVLTPAEIAYKRALAKLERHIQDLARF